MRYVAWIVCLLLCAPSAVFSEAPKMITNDDLEQRYGSSSQEEDVEVPTRSYGDELRDIRLRKEKEEAEQRKAQRKKECADLKEKINRDSDTTIENITSNTTRPNKYIGPYGDFVKLIVEYKSKCMTKKQAAELDQTVDRVRRQNQATTGTSVYPNTSSDCSSDYDCGMGQRCVKPVGMIYGTCMKAVNEYEGTEYNKRLDSGGPGKASCETSSDCPIGFRCDWTYKACVK